MNRIFIITIASFLIHSGILLSDSRAAEEFAHIQSVQECQVLSDESLDGDITVSERGACFSEIWARNRYPPDCDVVKNDPEYYQNCISDMAEALNDQELCQSVLRCDGCKSPKPPACAKHLEEQDWKKFDYTPLEKDVENNPAVASYCREYKVKDNQEKCFWGLSRKYFSGKADEVLSKKFKACLGKPSEELFELCARHGAETFLLENNQLSKMFKDVLRSSPARKQMFCTALETKKLYAREIREGKFFAASVKEFCPKINLKEDRSSEPGSLWPEDASAMMLLSVMAASNGDIEDMTISILEGGTLAADPVKGAKDLLRFHNRQGKMIAEYGISTEGQMGETLMLMLMVPMPRGARDFEIIIPGQEETKTWLASTILSKLIDTLPSAAFNDPESGSKERLLESAEALRELEERLGEDAQIEEHIRQMKEDALVHIRPEYFLATPEDAPASLPVEAMYMEQTFEILQHHYTDTSKVDEQDCENLWGVRKEANDNYRSLKDICRSAKAGATGGKSCERITDLTGRAKCMAQAAYDTDHAEFCDRLPANSTMSPGPVEICKNELKRMQAPAPKNDYVGKIRKTLKELGETMFLEVVEDTTIGVSAGD